jgi:hypothetical protein
MMVLTNEIRWRWIFRIVKTDDVDTKTDSSSVSTYSPVHAPQENTMSWLNAHFGARAVQGGMRPPRIGKFSGEVSCYGHVSNEPSMSG